MAPPDLEEKKPLIDSSSTSYGSSSSGAGKESRDDEKDNLIKPVSKGGLFRYATAWDTILILVGSLFAVVHGAGWPVMMVVFGKMTDSFIMVPWCINGSNGSLPNNTDDKMNEDMNTYALYYVYIGSAVLVASYFQAACWASACERQTHKLRKEFFRAIMRQEIAWFDERSSGELTARLADDLERVREGLGDKCSFAIQFVAAFFAGFAIGFWKGWKLALVMMSLTPLLAVCAAFMMKLISSFSTREQESYASAGGVAEEVLSCMRTVISFCGQDKEVKRYETKLEASKKLGLKKSIVSGTGMGLTMFIMFGAYGLAFWYGSTLVQDYYNTCLTDDIGGMSPGTVLTVFFCVLIGSFSIGNASPHLTIIATAKGSAKTLYEIIDGEPSIDSSSPDGERLGNVTGNLEFVGVDFNYPTRPDVEVLKNLNLQVTPGKTIALVGASGSGKSTVVNLIQRFYDPLQGQILLDGHDIRTLNLEWLRELIGIVSQEPILFGCSIIENIRYGRMDVTDDEIHQAAKMANAHEFINGLPQTYNTLVGERGAQLSGGQKQRVAIARALVRNPKILLLDEATSALDAESEGVVQAALDKASQGRTSIVIAHRLSTIQNADLICVFDSGTLVEQGQHTELMDKQGAYYQLVTLQTLGNEDEQTHNKAMNRPVSPTQKTPRKESLKKQMSKQISILGKVKDIDEEPEEEVEKPPALRILALNKPETCSIVIGCIAAMVVGASMPAFAFLFAEIIKTFAKTGEELKDDATLWSLTFVGLGVVTGLGHFLMSTCFGNSGENLTMRLRSQCFKNILRQDVAYFDDEKHSTGALAVRLATDASMVKNATGIRIAVILQSAVSLIAGLVIAFIYGWQLALAILGAVPFMAAAGTVQMKAVSGNQKRDAQLLEDAGKTASEAIENIRTVQSLTREQTFYDTYCNQLLKPYKESLKQAQIYGLAFALSQGIVFYLYAGAFRLGAYFVTLDYMQYEDVYRVFFAIAFSGMAIGQASSFLPDYTKARTSAGLIFKILNTVPGIDSYSTLGISLSEMVGDISFNGVEFHYPTRPDVQVLKGINLQVEPGKTLALVGMSGCGKSTIVSLLQRFYDPAKGNVMIDNFDIKSMNIQWLRSNISVVSQEPVLFDCSIKENITYGLTQNVPDDMVIQAARSANIHEFITSLPLGYETMVGEKGTQLSGGQKQRVAIARAIITNPKILLLDEATSALDTESEKVVQEALDKAREGRTCIVIAHRLSTIQNADKIAVIEDGRVVEQGTHQQLLAKKGAYHTLASGQLSLKGR